MTTLNLSKRFRWITSLFAGSLFLAHSALLWAQTPAKNLDPDHARKMAQGLELFKTQVKPMLMEKCVSCHGGGKKLRGEFDLSDREELLKGGSTGPAIVSGKSKDSLLFHLITHAKEPRMPDGDDKLTDREIAAVAKWIDLGAPYDDPLVARADKVKPWTQREVDPAARDFWAFQPLKRALPPAVKDKDWCRTPVDRFILAKLENAGIAPNGPAEKRKLIRRVYLDVIGLPPTPEEVDAFLADKSADAYTKMVDRLLASRHFGEKWASHWLDLARFGESHGFEHDYDRPSAYHYRDFVIQALNMDLPYDKFVRWQIAGDELEPDNRLANMATGFLAAGVHSTQITKNEVEKHRYDELDDKLNTLGTAMLGLSFGCARCHDHKYDPIPQADYYRMLATFTTTVRSEVELDFDPEGYAKAKAVFDKEHAPLVDTLRKFEQEQLPPKLQAWEKSRPPAPWLILDPAEAKSKGGANLVKQSDGSLLAGGTQVKNDTYTLKFHPIAKQITAVRLEALSHPSLVKGGPGRAANGNFALTDLKIKVLPKFATPGFVQLQNPRATFEQKGFPIKAVIDSDPKSGWAVDPQFGKDHAAVFEIMVGFLEGSDFEITLSFQNNDNHSLGRLRFSVATSKEIPELLAPALPLTVQTILDTPEAKRSKDQQTTLLQWFSTIDPDGKKLHQKIDEHSAKAPKRDLRKVLIASEGLPAVRLHTQGGDFLDATHFLRRGDANNKEGVAEQGFLQVLMNAPDREKHWQTAPPPGWRTSYRRVALANWVTDTDHGAGHLLARVIVNRLWQHYAGRGIVATPSDFGNRGEPPTHPELLDYLATELINNGWKLKPIHRLILTSAVYTQSGDHDEARAKSDPDNKLCWYHPHKRLSGELIRDSLLSISGTLDAKMFGPGTLDEAMKRRSIYFTVKRSKLIPMLQIFDAPQALSGVGQRPSTTIAPQALWLMNNPEVRHMAHNMANRIAPTEKTTLEDAISRAYLLALSRPPSSTELADSIQFVQQQAQTYPGASARESALTDFCQVLMCLNEFIYVE
jgi:mono/diheme cytochrome c family protein